MVASVSFSGVDSVNFASGGAARFIPLSNGAMDLIATEASVQIKYRTAGFFSKMWWFVVTNAATATSTIIFRKNTANGNETVSIGAAATGFFQDITNQDNIVAGDLVCYSISNGSGAGALTLATMSILFTPTTPTSTVVRHAYVAISATVFSTASTTFYMALGSGRNVGNQTTTEANTQNYVGFTGTIANLLVDVSSNPRGTTTTVNSRKNTANGNMSVSIGAAATGLFEDTVNTDSVVSGDLVNYSLTTGSGGGSLVPETTSSEVTSTDRHSLVIFGNPTNNVTQANSLTRFLCVGGWMSVGDATENNVRVKTLATFIASKLSTYIASNNVNGTSTLTLRANAANTSLVASIGASATGRFSDLVNTPTISVNDILTYGLVTGGSSGSGFNLSNAVFSAQFPASTQIRDIAASKGVVPFAR